MECNFPETRAICRKGFACRVDIIMLCILWKDHATYIPFTFFVSIERLSKALVMSVSSTFLFSAKKKQQKM